MDQWNVTAPIRALSLHSVTIKASEIVVAFLVSIWAASACVAADDFQTLFAPLAKAARPTKTGNRTFIFWVNGDADHFQSGLAYSAQDQGKTFRVDRYDVDRIRAYSEKCESCNVVILHHQRGGAHWYTTHQPWATYLRVYSAGTLIAERHIPIGNAADSRFLADLLSFTEELPSQPAYLIYRGHSFIPNYDPQIKGEQVTPFAYGFPESPYGLEIFKKSLRDSKLKKPLEAIVFAACSMAHLDTALAIAPYTKRLVASQVDILETLSSGFLFAWTLSSGAISDEEEFSRHIARTLMGNIDLASFIPAAANEAMMEYPVTLMNLRGLSDFEPQWDALRQRLKQARADSLEAYRIQRVISDQYAQNLRANGLSAEKVRFQSQILRMPSLDSSQVDALGLLKNIKNAGLDSDFLEQIGLSSLVDDLRQRLHVYHRSSFSDKSGLSMSVGFD